MVIRLGCAAVCLALLAACGGDGRGTAGPAPSLSPDFRTGTVIIETDDGAVMVEVEVADTPEQQALGLMHRESLPADAGMVFLFFDDRQSGFWMKNTLIPLSIAYFDRTGEILEIMDMEPCEADPCESYTPGVAYRGALEVNQGAFQEWGVEVGDRLKVSP